MNYQNLADKSLAGELLSKEESMAVLNAPDADLLLLIAAAQRVRQAAFGNRVKLNFLLNAKSGLCPEDCFYCSQSKISEAAIDQYPFLKEEEILSAAERAQAVHAKRFCMVNSGRAPTNQEILAITSATQKIKSTYPNLEVCVCLGLLNAEHGKALKESGVDAYNHNLNTAESRYKDICTTHTYKDRIDSVKTAQSCGIQSCSGCLLGMGESDADRIELAETFRSIKVESLPINFLMPIPGTPLAEHRELTPQKCLKILALFRFINPKAEIRIAGGRELHLGWLQPLGLYIANSIFIGDYLTTRGQKPEDDLKMIQDLGFTIEGETNAPLSVAQKEVVLK